MPAHDYDQPGPADPDRPEQAIAAAAAVCSNWGRWGDGDVRGTLNFLTGKKRVEGARLVLRGVTFSLAQPFEATSSSSPPSTPGRTWSPAAVAACCWSAPLPASPAR